MKMFSILLLCALTSAAFADSDNSETRPNIILIFADDLGIETLNAYGGHGVRTPHLDKLASSGMLFSHCFANPACSPSRAEIMTGTYPRFTGINRVLTYWKDDFYLDPKKFNSFANQLDEAGYATAVAGKWNISWLERNDTVKALGFDEHCLWQMYDRDGVKRSRFYQPYFRINGEIEEDSIADRFGPDVLADFMVDFIERKKDEPFLIYYPALLVHTPWIRVPGGPKTTASPISKQKGGPECFPEMVEYLDKNVGRLVNAVDELGLSDDTIILFCADNGTHELVTSIWGENNTRIKGGKMTMTDRGSRVPLIASWPGTIQPGTQCDDLVELADFLPHLPGNGFGAQADAACSRTKFPATAPRRRRTLSRMGPHRVQGQSANQNQGVDLHRQGRVDPSERAGPTGKPTGEIRGSCRCPGGDGEDSGGD